MLRFSTFYGMNGFLVLLPYEILLSLFATATVANSDEIILILLLLFQILHFLLTVQIYLSNRLEEDVFFMSLTRPETSSFA